MSKRNLRKKPRISYYEPEEPDLDEYVFCDDCCDYVYEYCAIHGPLLVLPDDKVPSPTGFPDFVPYAALTVPHEFLHLAPSNIPGAGIGVFTTLTLPKGVRFGPYRGVRTKDADSEYCWQIYSSSGGGRKPVCVVDALDARRSNWMRYVNCSRHSAEQNLLAYQYQGELYYRTIKLVPRFSELLVFYGAEFARSLRIDLRLYDRVEGLRRLIGSSVNKPELKSIDTTKQPTVEKPNIDSAEKLPAVEKTLKKHISIEESVSKPESATNELPKPMTNGATKWKPPQKKIKKKDTLDAKDGKESKISVDNTTKNHSKINEDSDVSTMIATLDSTQVKINNSLSTQSIDASDTRASKEKYNCDMCNKKFTQKDDLNKHLKIHTGEKPYACDICDKRFTKKGNLNAHIRTHTGEKPYACDICNKKFTIKCTLNNHLRTHTGEKPYACDICDKRFTKKGNLNAHIRTHTGEKPNACDICNKKFTQKDYLNKHLRIHTGEKPYACDICNKKFTMKCTLNNHLRIHTGEKPYACDICNKKFTLKRNLSDHLRIHTGEKPYSCDICNKKFTQKCTLNDHLRIHTGEKPYACDICNKKFTMKCSLNDHLRIHTGEKPYACDICNKKFTSKSHLNYHLRIHTVEKPYACDICNKKFTMKCTLNNHLRTHIGEKPYACDICNKKFTMKYTLNNHLRTHTGEKPYACDVCNKKFTQKGDLNNHLRIHTGEKPYACDICNKKFTQKSHLKTHLRIHAISITSVR